MIFDTHSHLVPAVDDGSRSYEESEELIKSAAEQGVDAILVTPHYYMNRPSDPSVINKCVQTLGEMFPEIGIYPGNEVLYFESMTEKLQEGEILTLAGSDYVLIEFYPNESYQRIKRAIKDLRYAGYLPVIAHAERYLALESHGLTEIIADGAYIQVSIEPIGGNRFHRDTKFVRKAIKNEEVHFIGSDMHRIDKRPPVLSKSLRWIRKHEREMEDTLYQNTLNIVNNIDFLY